MQLRNHPLMVFEGKPNWPPTWLARDSSDTLTGEIGVLKFVIRDSTSDTRCFLRIECDGRGYIGSLRFDQAEFCSRICELLHDHIGRLIKDIGDLDVV